MSPLSNPLNRPTGVGHPQGLNSLAAHQAADSSAQGGARGAARRHRTLTIVGVLILVVFALGWAASTASTLVQS